MPSRIAIYLMGRRAYISRHTMMSTGAETPDTRRKRLRYRSWHRGMQEMDLLLGRFADAQLAALSDAELDQFEHLLRCSDQDLFDWLTGARPWPAHLDNALARRLRDFTHRGPVR